MPSTTEITVPQLSRLVGLPGAPALVDVRSDEDYAADPRLIPSSRRRAFRDAPAWAEAYRGRSVVVVCRQGHALSQGAAAWLRCMAEALAACGVAPAPVMRLLTPMTHALVNRPDSDPAALVRRCDFGDGPVRYEHQGEDGHHHHHVICRKCRKVTSLDQCLIESLEKGLQRQGFSQISHSLEFFALCEKCAQ